MRILCIVSEYMSVVCTSRFTTAQSVVYRMYRYVNHTCTAQPAPTRYMYMIPSEHFELHYRHISIYTFWHLASLYPRFHIYSITVNNDICTDTTNPNQSDWYPYTRLYMVSGPIPTHVDTITTQTDPDNPARYLVSHS